MADVISLSSSDSEASDFENDVPPVYAFQHSSSPAFRQRPPPPARPRSLSNLSQSTVTKRKAADAAVYVTELVSSSDSDLPQGDAAFKWTHQSHQGSSPLVHVQPVPRRSRSPPLKKAKSASRALDAITALSRDVSTFQVPNAVASTSASASLAPRAPARRTASAPSASAGPVYSDIIDDTSEIHEFTEEVQSEDLDVDEWQERQRTKSNGKGKQRELITGATQTDKGKEKAKPTGRKKGKTDEEKAAELAEKARKKAEAEAIKAQTKAALLEDKERKKIMQDANKLRSSKTETFKEILVDVSGSSQRPGSPFVDIVPVLRVHLEEKDSSLHFFDSNLDQPPSLRADIDGLKEYSPPTIIKFRRKLKARYSEEEKAWIPIPTGPTIVPEKTAIVYLTAQELVDHLEPVNTLLDLPGRVRESLELGPKASVMVVIQGLTKLYSKKKSNANKDFAAAIRQRMNASTGSGPAPKQGWEQQMGKEDIERELVRLQIAERCFITCAESDDEVLTAIVSIAGDVAHRPYKLIERSHLSFSAHSNKGKSLDDTYCKMLEQIPRVTTGVSKIVQQSFPTFRSLMESYDKLEAIDRREEATRPKKQEPRASSMLAEMRVGHTAAGVPNDRRLGPALSKDFHRLLRGENGDALVNKG